MPVPNSADAAFPDQAQVDSQDLEIYGDGAAQTGVVSGCAVTSTAAANGSVSAAAGQVKITARLVTTTLTTVAIPANASGFTRYDLIVCDSTGVPSRLAGTAAASPVFPVVPSTTVALAAVRVPNGHTVTTVIPANTVTDKRVFLPQSPYRTVAGGGQPSLPAEFEVLGTDFSLASFNVQGSNVAIGNNTALQVTDYLGAPIMAVSYVGGMYVNDDLTVCYSVFGPKPFLADIYGYQWQGKQCSYSFPGPPGNMLDFLTSCHEQYNASRLQSLGSWGVVAGCTMALFSFSLPPVSPTGYRSGIRMTATGTTIWISTPSGVSAWSGCVAGDLLSMGAMIRSNSAAAGRAFVIRADFYTAAGVQVGGDVNGSNVTVPNTGVFTAVNLDGVIVPATATRVQLSVLGTVVAGESFDMSGAGIMKGQQTFTFAPPFVAQTALTNRTESGATAGDRWQRTDTPTVPGQREYVCTVGGLPGVQYWQPLDTSTVQRMYADQSNATITAANIAPFTATVAANGIYMFDYVLTLTTALTSTGWTLGFTGPASPTAFFAVCEYQSSATAWTTATIQSLTTFTAVAASYAATPNQIMVRIKAKLENGVNAGVLNLQFRSSTTSAVVVKKGSILSVT